MTIRLYKRLGLYLYCYGDEHLITHFEQMVGIKRKEPMVENRQIYFCLFF